VWFANSDYKLCESEGWSMFDKLPPWNINLVDTTATYEIGDTVLAYSPISGRLITHDIVAINGTQYQTKGYNDHTNPIPDGWVDKEDIIGEVVRVPVLNVPAYINLSLFILGFGLVSFFGWALSSHHDMYEDEYKGAKKSLFEGLMLLLVKAFVLYWIIMMIWIALVQWGL